MVENSEYIKGYTKIYVLYISLFTLIPAIKLSTPWKGSAHYLFIYFYLICLVDIFKSVYLVLLIVFLIAFIAFFL